LANEKLFLTTISIGTCTALNLLLHY
jgi:hypothetical protein